MNANRPNFTWPALVIGVGVLSLLISADTLPEAYGDLLLRSWPVLLIIFGLNILLAGRIRYANWLILVFSVGLVVAIANFAYAERSSEYRDDYTELWQDTIPDTVQQIVVNINTTDTLVALTNAVEPRQARVEFEGSTESELSVELLLQDNETVAVFNITESRSGILPRLAEVGRGQMNVFLPWGVFVQELNFENDDGPVTLDLTVLSIRWVDATLGTGNMQLCLPTGLATDQFVMIGNQITVDNGSLRVVVPEGEIGLSLSTGRSTQPTYIPSVRSADYDLLADGTIESENVLNEQFEVLLDLQVDGELIIDHELRCQQS